MAVQSLTTINNLLKTQYLPSYIDGFQENDDILKMMLKNAKPADGGDSEKLVRVGRNSGVGFRGDNDDLPTPGSSSWVKHTVTPRLFYGAIRISGPAVARTKSGGPGSTKSFLKAFVDEADHTMSWAKKRANMALWGGKEGIMAVLDSDPSTGTTLTLQGPGEAALVALPNQNAGTRHFPFGNETVIDVVDVDTTTIHQAGISVTGVDHAAGTLTIGTAAAAAMTTGDWVVLGRGLTTSDTYLSDSFEGLQAAVDNGDIRTTYHGLSRATYPQLKANVLKAASPYTLRDISPGLMEDLIKTVQLNSGDDPNSGKYHFRTSLGLHTELAQMEMPFKRYAGNELKPGFKPKLQWNGLIPIEPDVDCPYEAVYLLREEDILFLETDKLGFLDEDGRVLHKVAGKDAYEAQFRWYGNPFVQNLHRMGVIRNLNDTSYKFRS